MTKTNAMEVLKYNMEMCRFNPMTGKNIPISKEAEELAEACEIAINCIDYCRVMVPRWKTMTSVDELLVEMRRWEDMHPDKTSLIDFEQYLLEQVDFSDY